MKTKNAKEIAKIDSQLDTEKGAEFSAPQVQVLIMKI